MEPITTSAQLDAMPPSSVIERAGRLWVKGGAGEWLGGGGSIVKTGAPADVLLPSTVIRWGDGSLLHPSPAAPTLNNGDTK